MERAQQVVEIGPLVRGSILSVGPDHSLADAARKMVDRKVGSAVVIKDDGPGIITERDLLRAMADGAHFPSTPVSEYMTSTAISASRSWDVRQAAKRMIDGGFRHLVVLDDTGQPIGVLSIRDLVEPLLET